MTKNNSQDFNVPVTIPDMMACRERRVEIQNRLLKEYSQPVISFCMNIPGPTKNNQLILQAFEEGCAEIKNAVSQSGWTVFETVEIHENTGNELLLSVDGDAEDIKDKISRIEETHPLGRLYDLDVLNEKGEKLSRQRHRTCFICGRPAQDCASSRRHTAEELYTSIMILLKNYYS